MSTKEQEENDEKENEEDCIVEDSSMGKFYCHANGCIQEENGGDRNTATNHNCSVCKRAVHVMCCMRIVGIQVDGPEAPLLSSDCYE